MPPFKLSSLSRTTLWLLFTACILASVPLASSFSRQGAHATAWAAGFEGQRKADLGDGRYLNPIFAGDHPDPSVLKDGQDYYITFSSFDAYPGLVIWHSRDLVNWEPVGPALFRNGFYNLGRQTLLEPIEWTDAGWFRTSGYDVAAPIPKPAGDAVPHGMRLSDDFSTNKMGVQWSFYNGTDADRGRYRYENGALVLQAKGTTPADASPLWFVS